MIRKIIYSFESNNLKNMTVYEIGRYYEDYKIGQSFKHATSKTIFESDNNLFSLLTMNHHPIHTNIDYASGEQHEQVLVVGTLVFCLVVGFTVPDISGKAIANLGYEDIRHLAPVFINDTLYARSTILDCTESKSKNDRGIIYVETIGTNQKGEEVLSFRRKVLIKKKKNN